MRGFLTLVVGLGVILPGAVIWSAVLPMWLVVVAGFALVLWVIVINDADSRRLSDQAEERRWRRYAEERRRR